MLRASNIVESMGLTLYCDYERKGIWNLLVYEGFPIGK